MCHGKPPHDAEFPCIVTDRRGQGNGMQPKLSVILPRLYVDVSRFPALVAEEKEAVHDTVRAPWHDCCSGWKRKQVVRLRRPGTVIMSATLQRRQLLRHQASSSQENLFNAYM